MHALGLLLLLLSHYVPLVRIGIIHKHIKKLAERCQETMRVCRRLVIYGESRWIWPRLWDKSSHSKGN